MRKISLLIIISTLLQLQCLAQDCIVGNCKEGYGEKVYKDGDRFEGYWKNGQKHGKGTYFWKDGRKLIGFWKDGSKEGFGKFYSVNGNVTEGEFRNDKWNGLGTYYDSSGNVIFAGEWFNGERVVKSSNLPKDIQADKYLLEAKKLMEDNKFKEAIVSFNQILALGVSPPMDFYYYLGKCHYSAGNNERSVQNLNEYLLNVGKNGEFYIKSLEILSEAESGLNRTKQNISDVKFDVKNCSICHGDGYYNKKVNCSRCKGDGRVRVNCNNCGGKGRIPGYSTCMQCYGNGKSSFTSSSGQYIITNCQFCNGNGKNWSSTGKDCGSCNLGKVTKSCSSCGGDGLKTKKTICYNH
ncbi:tetratricopeptide repeat protein [Robertkochia aurantiaca]|uniref:tetratricopeptide repeat protein n=1 Tax=Robertkochia aurantiaca TaxID=2873700 RepID=UPI001CCB77C0|nr:tetratricopeptide repeat protein [Robertkochia sp. 3YJGBD-33]